MLASHYSLKQQTQNTVQVQQSMTYKKDDAD